MMKAKAITSISLGLLLPWIYFEFSNSQHIRYIDAENNTLYGENGLLGLIEFYGFLDVFILYAKAVVICTIFIFIICSIYDFICKFNSSS